jgi:hypothetical protein
VGVPLQASSRSALKKVVYQRPCRCDHVRQQLLA